MARRTRKQKPRPSLLIAYDFETTKIEAGTPRPLYLTACNAALGFEYATPIKDMAHLSRVLTMNFLTPEFRGAKFVAWYGNNFDAYFIAAALLNCPEFIMRPYLTRSNALRGLKVIYASDADNPNASGWEFLDGAAMLGLAGVTLAKFLANFAPEFGKMTGVIDFERETFDAKNPAHCAYAMRDSVGLWHGMQRAQSILMERFDQPLAVTMGGACIKIFKAHIPEDVTVATPRDEVLTLVRDYVMRGGFCYCVKRYHGPVWKYDINQAYAAAMRDAQLPAGFTSHCNGRPPKGAAAIVRLTASKPDNIVPFYHRTERDACMRSAFGVTRIDETWLTSIELDQLDAEGWDVHCFESWAWEESFSMRDYVDKLERLRMTCEGGPSGPIGTMVKMVGNHSYGKTVEQLEPMEYMIAAECPEGYEPFYADEAEPLEHVFFRFVEDARPKDYHQPQLGAFITAHVRMVLRRAALLAPRAWLYADTDCVVFSQDVTAQLDIHPSRYGAWKVEDAGTVYKIIAKKVYTQDEGDASKRKRSAKGLNVKKLTPQEFDEWFEGAPPVQNQVQRNNFIAVMRGRDMYRLQTRQGTAIDLFPTP